MHLILGVFSPVHSCSPQCYTLQVQSPTKEVLELCGKQSVIGNLCCHFLCLQKPWVIYSSKGLAPFIVAFVVFWGSMGNVCNLIQNQFQLVFLHQQKN